MKLTKDQKRFGLVLLALLLLYYFYIKGNKAKAQQTSTTVGGRPPVDEIIAIQNSDTDYPNNPTLLCCNSLGTMVSMMDNTVTQCTGNFTSPVNGVCPNDPPRPQTSTFSTTQDPK